VAEELVMNEMTTGAGNDLERVTELARRMVTEWGMSERIGPLTFGGQAHEVFLGRDFMQHKEYSESTAVIIDEEIRKIIETAYDGAHNLLSKNNEALHVVATALLTREVLDGEEIAVLVEGRELPELKPTDDGSRGQTPGEPDSEEELEQAAEEQSAQIPALDEGQPAEG